MLGVFPNKLDWEWFVGVGGVIIAFVVYIGYKLITDIRTDMSSSRNLSKNGKGININDSDTHDN